MFVSMLRIDSIMFTQTIFFIKRTVMYVLKYLLLVMCIHLSKLSSLGR